MMDIFMIGTLAVSFGLVWLLIRWCQKRWITRNPKSHGKESKTVIALGIIVLLLGAYLVYALVHPERF